MWILRGAKALDRRDLLTLMHDGKCQAGVYSAAVNDHGARSALSVIASFFGTGQM